MSHSKYICKKHSKNEKKHFEKKKYDGKRHAHEYHKKQSNVIMHSLVKDMSKKGYVAV